MYVLWNCTVRVENHLQTLAWTRGSIFFSYLNHEVILLVDPCELVCSYAGPCKTHSVCVRVGVTSAGHICMRSIWNSEFRTFLGGYFNTQKVKKLYILPRLKSFSIIYNWGCVSVCAPIFVLNVPPPPLPCRKLWVYNCYGDGRQPTWPAHHSSVSKRIIKTNYALKFSLKLMYSHTNLIILIKKLEQ